jgi:hypothetical protein
LSVPVVKERYSVTFAARSERLVVVNGKAKGSTVDKISKLLAFVTFTPIMVSLKHSHSHSYRHVVVDNAPRVIGKKSLHRNPEATPRHELSQRHPSKEARLTVIVSAWNSRRERERESILHHLRG